METTILIAQLLLKYGPGVAAGVAALFEKKEVTLDDWQKVFAMAEKSYDDYVGPNAETLKR